MCIGTGLILTSRTKSSPERIDDRFFLIEVTAQTVHVKCPFALTFLGSEVCLWARHIFVNSLPVVVRYKCVNQSITMLVTGTDLAQVLVRLVGYPFAIVWISADISAPWISARISIFLCAPITHVEVLNFIASSFTWYYTKWSPFYTNEFESKNSSSSSS